MNSYGASFEQTFLPLHVTHHTPSHHTCQWGQPPSTARPHTYVGLSRTSGETHLYGRDRVRSSHPTIPGWRSGGHHNKPRLEPGLEFRGGGALDKPTYIKPKCPDSVCDLSSRTVPSVPTHQIFFFKSTNAWLSHEGASLDYFRGGRYSLDDRRWAVRTHY